MKKIIGLLLISATVIAAHANVCAARTTRDLVFEDATPEIKPNESPKEDVSGRQSLAIKTTVILEREGKQQTVAPSHQFKSGDKVKLVFTPSTNGYVYWMSKGSTGNYSLLYPTSQTGMDNSVIKNVEYTIPAKGSFKFDANTGHEELLCILSTERIADLDSAVAEQLKNSSAKIAQLEEQSASKRKSRDLVFEEEEKGDVSTKKQEASTAEPMVVHYKLSHE